MSQDDLENFFSRPIAPDYPKKIDGSLLKLPTKPSKDDLKLYDLIIKSLDELFRLKKEEYEKKNNLHEIELMKWLQRKESFISNWNNLKPNLSNSAEIVRESLLIDLESFEYGGSGGFVYYKEGNDHFLANHKIKIPCSEIRRIANGSYSIMIKFVADGVPFKSRRNPDGDYDEAKKVNSLQEGRTYLDNYIGSYSINDWCSEENGWYGVIRYISAMNIGLIDKFELARDFNLLETVKLLGAFFTTELTFSLEQFLNSVKYKPSPTSNNILSKEDIVSRILPELNFENLISYFEIPEALINELKGIELDSLMEFKMGDPSRFEDKNYDPYEIYLTIKRLNQELTEFIFPIFREKENFIRSELGYNLVGSLFSETFLFKKLKKKYPNTKIVSQYSPRWLGRQRIDIFIVDFNLGIEYNGQQHYEPIEYYGGQESFEATTARDELKRQKCKANNCNLLEIKYDLTIEDALLKIQSAIEQIEENK